MHRYVLKTRTNNNSITYACVKGRYIPELLSFDDKENLDNQSTTY